MPRDRYVVRALTSKRGSMMQLALFERGGRKLRRVWYPYDQWEEYQAGMWRTVHGQEAKRLLNLAIVFTGNAEVYGTAMQAVIEAWPISCALNLTTTGMNRHAWIGHAACAYAHRLPEHIVREAWHCLSQRQQDEANWQAASAIRQWEETHGHAYR